MRVAALLLLIVALGAATAWLALRPGPRPVAHHDCRLADGVLSCWGPNAEGQVGSGTGDVPAARPAPVLGPGRVFAFAVGGAHTCACAEAGQVYCWGRNTGGQVGVPAGAPVRQPTAVAGASACRQIAAG